MRWERSGRFFGIAREYGISPREILSWPMNLYLYVYADFKLNLRGDWSTRLSISKGFATLIGTLYKVLGAKGKPPSPSDFSPDFKRFEKKPRRNLLAAPNYIGNRKR